LWLIDIGNGLVTINQLDGSRFAAAEILHARGILAVSALPGISLNLEFIDSLR